MGNEMKARPTLSSAHKAMASSGKKSAGAMMGAKSDQAAGSTSAGEPGADTQHSELYMHPDGSAQSVTSDGVKTEHPSLHHAAVHIMAHHAPGEKHMALHHDGGSTVTTHHHSGGAEGVQGPHEHDAANLEGLKQHMDQFLSEEQMEGGGGGMPEAEPAMAGGSSSSQMY
jgi:hypothetical protein